MPYSIVNLVDYASIYITTREKISVKRMKMKRFFSAYLYTMPNQFVKDPFSLGKQIAIYVAEYKRIDVTGSNHSPTLALVPA